MTLQDIRGEISLIRKRRGEIVAAPHPHIYKSEYINLCRREAELMGELEFRYMITPEMRKGVMGT